MDGRTPITDGRTNQLTMIRRVLADAGDRSRAPDVPAAILLEGDPGIGRSTALAAMSRHAAAGGFTVAGVCCDPQERGLHHRAALALLDPLARSGGLRPEPGESEPHLLDRIVDAACSRSAVLLLADDLQWCDESSLRWLARLARRIRQVGPGRLVLLAGMRDGESVSSAEVFADFAGHCRRIRLAGLGRAQLCEIAETALGGSCDPAFGQALLDLTGGNPRLVYALLGELAARGLSTDADTAAKLASYAPKSVADDIHARMRSLGPDAVALAEAVAVLGRHAELPAAAQLAGLSAERAGAAADRLSDRRILRRRQPLAFRHGLVAAAVVRFLAAGRSNELHLRAAAYLHKAGADVRETAEQLLRTSPSGESWVCETLGEAAQVALVEGQRDDAIAYLRRAEREPMVDLEEARAGAARTSLEIYCFGGFRLLRGGRCLDGSAMRPRVRSLLQLLALHACHPVHRELLLEALWPGVDIQAGIRNLQVTVSQLRAFLEPESPHGDRQQRLRREGESYRLALLPGDRCDVREFESAVLDWKNVRGAGSREAIVKPLRMARAWYGGDLLPEAGPSEWVVGDRLRLRAMASTALAALAETELGLGRADAACDAARSSLEIDEYQDASWRVLIAAYRRLGSHAAAERARREYEKILRGLEM